MGNVQINPSWLCMPSGTELEEQPRGILIGRPSCSQGEAILSSAGHLDVHCIRYDSSLMISRKAFCPFKVSPTLSAESDLITTL